MKILEIVRLSTKKIWVKIQIPIYVANTNIKMGEETIKIKYKLYREQNDLYVKTTDKSSQISKLSQKYATKVKNMSFNPITNDKGNRLYITTFENNLIKLSSIWDKIELNWDVNRVRKYKINQID